MSYLTDHAGNPIANQQGGALETQAGGFATAYVSQIGATDLSAGSPTARATALGGSALASGNPTARTTALGSLALASGTPMARASALGSLALIGGTPNARTSTLGFQVLSAVASVAKLTAVTVVPASATIDLGDNFSFFAEGSFADGTSRVLHESEIAWSADEGTEITAAGNAHPTQLGTSTITATPANNITNPPSVPTSNP